MLSKNWSVQTVRWVFCVTIAILACSPIVNVFQGCAEGDIIVLFPVADTYSVSEQENVNRGTSEHMEVYYYYEKWEYIEDNVTKYALEDYSYVYIMFDLTQVPDNFIVDHASLTLYVWMSIYPISVGSFLLPTNDWNETSLTWSNAPVALHYSSDNVYVSAEDMTYSWDVSDFVRTTFGVCSLTIVLKPTMSGEGVGWAFFSAREDTNNMPLLTISGRYASPSSPSPDLTITDIIWSPVELREDKQIAFQASIQNVGSTPLLLNHRVDYYVDDIYVGFSEVGSIEMGGIVKAFPILIHPLKVGAHLVKAIADPTNAIPESNEQNNELQKQFTVEETPEEPVIEYGPDLVITEVAWEPVEPNYEDQIKFYVHVENCGNEPSVPIFDIKVWVNGEYIGRAQLGIVEIGENKRSNPIISYPLSEGVYAVRAVVDSENSVSETNEDNNEYQTEIYVIPEFPFHILFVSFVLFTFGVTLFNMLLKKGSFKRV